VFIIFLNNDIIKLIINENIMMPDLKKFKYILMTLVPAGGVQY